MRSIKRGYILFDESHNIVLDVDLSEDEWEEPTRPWHKALNGYRTAPTARDISQQKGDTDKLVTEV